MIETDYAVYSAILEPIFREKLELGRKYCSPILRGNRYETQKKIDERNRVT